MKLNKVIVAGIIAIFVSDISYAGTSIFNSLLDTILRKQGQGQVGVPYCSDPPNPNKILVNRNGTLQCATCPSGSTYQNGVCVSPILKKGNCPPDWNIVSNESYYSTYYCLSPTDTFSCPNGYTLSPQRGMTCIAYPISFYCSGPGRLIYRGLTIYGDPIYYCGVEATAEYYYNPNYTQEMEMNFIFNIAPFSYKHCPAGTYSERDNLCIYFPTIVCPNDGSRNWSVPICSMAPKCSQNGNIPIYNHSLRRYIGCGYQYYEITYCPDGTVQRNGRCEATPTFSPPLYK